MTELPMGFNELGYTNGMEENRISLGCGENTSISG